MAERTQRIPHLVRQIYEVVRELEALFPGRRFTPDGHLIGSLGEVLAAHHYGVNLYPASVPVHDGETLDGRPVQIKATQGKSVALRAEPELLLVLGIEPDGGFREIYNGPGRAVWASAGRMQSNGQRPIGVAKLARLMDSVTEAERIPRTQR